MVVPHGYGGVSHKVEHKDEHHEGRGEEDPADEPIVADPVTNHFLNAAIEPPCPKHPTDGDSLEEDTPQQGQTTRSVEVHELEHVDTALCDHRQPEQAHEHSHPQGELLPVRSQELRPVVHQACHEGLHTGELGVQAQVQQHYEEQEGPERRRSNGKNNLRINQEGKGRSGLDNISNLNTLLVCHVAKYGEDNTGREDGGERVNAANKDGVTVGVVMELVVATKS